MLGVVADDPLASLDVFWTELSPTRAVVYARLTGVAYRAGWGLSGLIRGPRSVRHQTLPTTLSFTDLGPGPTHLARAVVPDPSYWSPESPNIYDVTIELRRDGEPSLVEKRVLGFKPIRPGTRHLLREGKPWIPRGVRVVDQCPLDLAGAREQRLVLVLSETNEEPLYEASRQGANVALEVAGSSEDIVKQLRWSSRSPAVGFAVVRGQSAAAGQFREAAPNIILAQCIEGARAEVWGDIVWVPYGGTNIDAAWLRTLDKPIFWSAPIGSCDPLEEARRNCDQLQALLVREGYGQFAGYFV